MLHVAVTSCPNSLIQHGLQSSLELETPQEQGTCPPHSVHLPIPQPLASFWHCLIFPSENKTLTTVFLSKALSWDL